MRITLELDIVPVRPEPAPESSRLLTLQAWAEQRFGEYAPGYSTLRKWALDGLISPQPKKDGWFWLVEPYAEYKEKY